MTDEAKALVEECRLDAKAFRENTVYDSDGDPIRLIANADRLDQYADLIETQAREIERLREALSKADEAHWFYYGDDCSSEQCRFSIHECIDEDFEWDNRPVGDHVLQIAGARPVPDMWVSLHYFTEEEKDARQDDEPYAYTVHATEEEARAALAGDSHDQ